MCIRLLVRGPLFYSYEGWALATSASISGYYAVAVIHQYLHQYTGRRAGDHKYSDTSYMLLLRRSYLWRHRVLL